MQEEKEAVESLSNIDILWLKAIYEDLRNLESHIILTKTGFESLEEMIYTSPVDITEIQLRNLKLTIIKFLNLIDNVQSKISKEFFKEVMKILKILQQAITSEETGEIKPNHFKIRQDVRKKISWKELTQNFHKSVSIIDNLKSELIKELDPLLYFVKEANPLDKLKQKKIIR